jgi:signal transduction histidine kinase
MGHHGEPVCEKGGRLDDGGSPEDMTREDGRADDRRLRVAVVGASHEGITLLQLLMTAPGVRVVAVAHAEPETPALSPLRLHGIPIVASPGAVFDHGPEVVVDATTKRDVFEELERCRPAHVEVVGAGTARLFREIIGIHIREAQRLEKAETVRRMIGGVYHTLNNLFTTLLGRSTLLLDALKREPSVSAPVRDGVEVIDRTLGLGADILKRLRGLMRDSAEEPVARMDVRAIARDVVSLAEPMIREGEVRSATVDVQLHLDDVPPVVGRASDLLEVLLNLIVNAVEAMPDGGVLTVETLVEGDEVLVRVRDTGAGIPAAVKAKLFTPFFTTKTGGTGLGLNLSREIIRRHGGDVTVESAEGQGSCITVRLPAADLDRPDLRGWRVLVADDDELSRTVTVELLAAAGCQSDGVTGGEAALVAITQTSYDLVLLDIFMPDLAGWVVARAARSRQPAPIIGLFTGWDITPDDPIMRDSGADLLLRKPIRLAELLGEVQGALERRTGGSRH